ncbi:unnamed protein product [marine sediment metagenome]|uniref:Phosphoadenosine phosphosulphate reductase domain-containing protein n=1 Tax=marine sediment metagenome TaxID=412755 RepID=X0V053_9ZZZZ
MNIISYGGGVQTTALLVLTLQGKVESPATHAVFADTGSELQATYDHVDLMFDYTSDYLRPPHMERIGIKVVRTDLGPLHGWDGEMMLPMYFADGGFYRRQCTYRWKISPIRKWLREQGAKKATVQIGISKEESHRIKEANVKWITHRWPLYELGLNRQDCINIIQQAGLPVPPKSSCFMCPYRRVSEWHKLREGRIQA